MAYHLTGNEPVVHVCKVMLADCEACINSITKEGEMVPVLAQCVIANYKAMFKEKYKRDTTITDDEIFDIFNNVFDDEGGNKAQDELRVTSMFELEQFRENFSNVD